MLALVLAAAVADPALPPGAVARIGSPLLRHPGGLVQAVYSPDGERVAAVGQCGTTPDGKSSIHEARVWADVDGRPVARFRFTSPWPPQVGFGPTGDLLAAYVLSGPNPKLAVDRFPANRGRKRLLTRPVRTPAEGRWLAFLGPRQLVAVSGGRAEFISLPDGRAVTWDGPKGVRLARTQSHRAAVFWDNSRVFVVNPATGQLRFTWEFGAYFQDYVISPSGRRLLVAPGSLGSRDAAELWDMTTGNRLAFFPRGQDKRRCGEVLLGEDRVALLRDRHVDVVGLDGRRLKRVPLELDIQMLFASRDGLRLIGMTPYDKPNWRMVSWRTDTWQRSPACPVGGRGGAFRPDGQEWLSFAPWGHAVRLIDLDAGRERLPRSAVGDGSDLRFIDERRVALIEPWCAKRFDCRSGDDAGRVSLPTAQPTADESNGQVMVCRRTYSGHCLIDLSQPGGSVPCPYPPGTRQRLFRRGSRVYVAATQHRGNPMAANFRVAPLWVGVWDSQRPESDKFKLLFRAKGSTSDIYVDVSPDGRRAVEVGQVNGATLHHLASGSRRALPVPTGYSSEASARFNRGGRLAVISAVKSGAASRQIWAVEAATRRVLAGPFLAKSEGQDFALSPDGRSVAYLAADGSARMIDLASGSERAKFRGHEAPSRLAFSPSGRLLATLGAVTPVLIWQVPAAPKKEPTPIDPEALWTKMANQDPKVAFPAMAKLADDPERAVPFLLKKIRDGQPKIDMKEVERLIKQLNADDAAARRAATAKLAAMTSTAVEKALKMAVKDAPPEAARRIRGILAKRPAAAAALRFGRAVQALEWVGNEDVLKGLQGLLKADLPPELAEDIKSTIGRVKARIKKE